jgi:hypothetical protein
MGSILGFHLHLPGHMRYLDAGQDDAGATKILEAQHRSGDAFDGPMVVLDHVIQLLDLTNRDGRLALGVHRVQRGQIRAAFVDGYRLRHTILSDRLFKEAPCCHLVPLGSEQEINGFTRLVDRPVGIPPLAFDSDIRVSRPKEFHPESLAEPCVNLSIYTAPVIQPVLPDTASARTVAGMHSSSCATTLHCAACAVAEFCTCAEPSAQASGLDTDRAHAWLSDRRRRSSSTSHVS